MGVQEILKINTLGENLCWYYYDEYNSIKLIINNLMNFLPQFDEAWKNCERNKQCEPRLDTKAISTQQLITCSKV